MSSENETVALRPTVCAECERRAEQWLMGSLPGHGEVPVCLACCRSLGWLPDGPLTTRKAE